MAGIPIIGQAEVVNIGLSVLVKCSCGAHVQIVGHLGAVGACPNDKCDRMYGVGAPIQILGDGSVSLALGVGRKPNPLGAIGG